MANRRRQRERRNRMKEITNLIAAGALVIIAVLMVTALILFFRNQDFLGGLFGRETNAVATPGQETEEAEQETAIALEPGLNILGTGRIVYIISADDAQDYDEANLVMMELSGGENSSGGTAGTGYSQGENAGTVYSQGETAGTGTYTTTQTGASDSSIKAQEIYYCLANSWLELDGSLYYFGEEGYACTDSYSERAFDYGFNEDGILRSIDYNPAFSESSESANADYPGRVQTRALSVFMDRGKTWGDYVAIKYKRATESLTYYLGSDDNTQYASPYAYDISDGRIFYLALKDTASTDYETTLYEKVAGKVFCMTPGGETRYIAAEGALGFKVLEGSDGDPVVYYYDGNRIRQATDFAEDEDMTVFDEDAEYTVDIGTVGKAYLELVTGQRVTMASDSFSAGNFVYGLAADGEILSVAGKTTVSTGGYTYEFQNGVAFGENMTRLTRQNTAGLKEVISGEVAGQVGNIHYDYDSASIIAEYVSSSGGGGLLKASLDGDIDLITDSRVTSGSVTLFGISDGYAVYRVTDGDTVEFHRASISNSSPLSVAVEPMPLSGGDEGDDADAVGEVPGTPSSGDNDNLIEGHAPDDAGGQPESSPDSDTVVSDAPGGSDVAMVGPDGT